MTSESHLELNSGHRFTDPAYGDLTLRMRSDERAGEVFDPLVRRGEVVVHANDVERTAAVAALGNDLIIADTRERVVTLSAAIRDRRQATDEQAGARSGEPVTHRGGRIGIGDRVATRLNDRDLGVANRDGWTVVGIGDKGSLAVTGRAGRATHVDLPSSYVNDHVELALASTVYGAQGKTLDAAHLVVCETTGAASAYVGMTRGRHQNFAHFDADSTDDARRQWTDVFSRDRADLGPPSSGPSRR